MELFSIASGSSGNCICVGDEDTHILIDAGISGKRIEAGLNEMDLTVPDCSGLLVTHEHNDHIAGLGVIARRYGLPIYATRGTIRAVSSISQVGRIDESLFCEIVPGEDFSIGSLRVRAIPVSHDAAEPVAYRVGSGEKTVGVITDLGMYNQDIINEMSSLNAILIEANHDIHMLQAGSYPYNLKLRIAGERGHLSNEACGELLDKILNDNIKNILLGHLSKENNFPELALEAVRQEITLGDNPYRGSELDIQIAPRDIPSKRVIV